MSWISTFVAKLLAASPGLKVGNHQADVGAKLIERHPRPGKHQRDPVEWLLPLPPALNQVGIHCVEGKYYIILGRSFRNANRIELQGAPINLGVNCDRLEWSLMRQWFAKRDRPLSPVTIPLKSQLDAVYVVYFAPAERVDRIPASSISRAATRQSKSSVVIMLPSRQR